MANTQTYPGSPWPKVMNASCCCSWDRSRRIILVPNEVCPVHEPQALARRRLEGRRLEFSTRLKELGLQQMLLPGRIAEAKRALEDINRQLEAL